MSISLKKGQKVSLTKESAGLSNVLVGLGWDAVESKKGFLASLFGTQAADIDCDATAILLKDGKFCDKSDVVYFGNLEHKSGTERNVGDNLTGNGEGDDEQILIDLSKVPAEYDRIVIVVNIYDCIKRKQEFGMIKNAFIRTLNLDDEHIVAPEHSHLFAATGSAMNHDSKVLVNNLGLFRNTLVFLIGLLESVSFFCISSYCMHFAFKVICLFS